VTRKKILLIWLRFNLGLIIYAFGVYLTVHASIGVAPWEVLYFGLMNYIPVGYGTLSAMMAVLILSFDVWKGEKIGFGTLFDGLICGYYAQFFMWWDPLPTIGPRGLRILLYVLGLFTLSLGVYFAISSGQGCGPKDALQLVIARRFRKLSMGMVQFLIQAIAFLLGSILGGPVGLGSVLSVVFYGAAQQTVFNCFRYEGRNTVHMNLIETIKVLKNNGV